jgi:hypothetical protein
MPVVSVENRINPRAKIARKLRVRPSDGYEDHFEEVATSINVSKRGVYFQSDLQGYRVGLRLFVTYPFTALDDPMAMEYELSSCPIQNAASPYICTTASESHLYSV